MDFLNIPLWTALLAGAATFFSPCIIPVLPGFFAFLAGHSLSRKDSRWAVFRHTVVFTVGFTLVFVLLGIGVNVLGKPLVVHQNLFEKIGGILLIFFGITLTGIIPLPRFLQNEKRFPVVRASSQLLRDFLFGVTFGFAWTPCIGPILGAILFLATGAATAAEGGFLLFFFSVGLAVPFLIAALFVPELKKVLRKISFLARFAQWITGGVLILIGLLLFFGKLAEYSGILIEKFGTGLVF